jgi:hypothetical protein
MEPPSNLPALLLLTDGGVTVQLTWDGSAWWTLLIDVHFSHYA